MQQQPIQNIDQELGQDESQNKIIQEKTSFKIPPWLDFVIDLVKIALLAFIVVWPIHHFVFQPFYVVGPSMEPSFYDQEYLIIDEITYRFHEPQRGEVIIFASPNDPKDHLIKRLIALPGEKVVVKKGSVYVYNDDLPQGIKLNEADYLFSGTNTQGQIEIELADDEYYVLGDNRNVSMDSRLFGPIKREAITGRAWFRGWPFDQFGKIQKPGFAF